MERYSAPPGVIRQIMEAIGKTDVRPVLPTISVPTLVMHRREDSFLMVEHGRYLAEHIPGARYVELEGSDSLFSMGDSEAILGEIEEFVTGARHEREPDRVLATVLFTDIVRSTAAGRRAGRPRLAGGARAPRPAGAPGARPPPGAGGEVHRRRRAGHLRRPRPRDPRRRLHRRAAPRAWASRSAPGCTPASAR